MNEQRLAEIKERAEKAKNGPWVFDGDITYRKDGMLEPLIFVLYGGSVYIDEEDGEFIANARQDVPELVAEVERLRKALEFYADSENYDTTESGWVHRVDLDGGDIAREALE